MNPFDQRELGTSRGLADFHRFKTVLNQIGDDEVILKDLISRFLKKPSNQLLSEIGERSSILRSEIGNMKDLRESDGIEGSIFYFKEIEGRLAVLLEKADEILKSNISLHA